mgnify:CR=1 FL=1
MTLDEIDRLHKISLVSALDCAVDELRDALNDAQQLGAYDTPYHRRDADQDDAIIRVQETQEAVEECLELVFVDRYGMDVHVALEAIDA